ncbi:hypothetical protein Nocox_34300 [Nonomuraea coxensis DSM 45129]|uniref:Gram-positive cocci surface proteins LPxTG domain-containing protein n=1 Tax=Nonomuraea coxensis DSM 45129 TaxID=1122611 RepID=A0ABX8UAG4_9ACTN|nr:hypothetical protein [Nonomuraea coxensis]QYC44426.1 hypothetical protein Nocox_34300 [Nonomuraea coxensis DSM 45129]
MRVALIVPLAALLLGSAPASAAAPEVLDYTCTTTATGDKQNVKLSVELTVPATGGVQQNLSIGWKGAYSGSAQLLAPATGLEAGLNLYAYVGISRIPRLTSATGVAQLTGVVPGAPIALPTTTVNLTTTPPEAGTGTVHAASVNFGSSPQEPVIECELASTAGRKEHPLTISATGATPSPTPTPSTTPSETPTPTPTPTPTDDEEEDPEDDPAPEESESSKVPSGGVSTGGGGEAGPDGRALILTGSLLLLAGGTGLVLRRRRLS